MQPFFVRCNMLLGPVIDLPSALSPAGNEGVIAATITTLEIPSFDTLA